MHTICLTGGPCGGKSSALSVIRQKLEQRGYKVAVVPEAATKIITSGIVPGKNMRAFQRLILQEQLHNEDLFTKGLYLSESVKGYVLICDRGIGDQYAYMSDLDNLLNEEHLSKEEAFSRYDCVIHLETAAAGAEKYYQWAGSNGSNPARSESPEEARALDEKTLKGWIGHPHLRYIDNSTDFTEKIDRAMKEVFLSIGEPVPTECEHKYLIRRPDLKDIQALGYVSCIHIVQTYLQPHGDTERRVRRRGTEETGYSYYYTEKRDLKDGTRIETEHLIDAKAYATYIAFEGLHRLEKDRYCFFYENRYFELDIYDGEQEYAILEVEVGDMLEDVATPPLEIIREVTYDRKFRNFEIAFRDGMIIEEKR